VNEDSANQRKQAQAQVERWTAEAKKLVEAGDETGALELYRKAADELPGAPWLQNRTGELARKLKQPDAAILYFRRAATAFQLAQFLKRAVAPLRTAWTLAVGNLPSTSKALVELSLELIRIQRSLGFAADATVTLERTNAALRGQGFSEISPHTVAQLEREPASTRPAPAAATPPSSIAPRSASAPTDAPQSSPERALARSVGR
jgi:tetratricopeptide (TPR) repeat protein